jgi:methyltransferase
MVMTNYLFVLLVGGLILERLLELRASNKNMKRLLAEGGRLNPDRHYPIIVLMHVCFFASLIAQRLQYDEAPLSDQWPLFLLLFIAGQLLRFFSRRALAGRWTTRIVTMPGKSLVASGPYRYIPHPIYFAVGLELFSLPMIFGLWITAFVFTIWNLIMLLGFRIPAENRALSKV